MLLIISFGILTTIAWGVADIFIASSTKTIKPVFAAVLVNCLGAILFGLYYLLFVRQPVLPDFSGILLSAGAGVFIALASTFFFIGLHQGPVGIVSAISSTYPAVTLLIAIGIFGAQLSLQQSIGIGLVLIGVATASGLFSKTQQRKPNIGTSGPLFALLASCCWGVGYGLLAEGIRLLGWQVASLFQFSVLLVCYLVLGLSIKRRYGMDRITLFSSIKNPFILGAALTQQTGSILLNIGLGLDSTGGSIMVALSACYPVLTMVLAFIYFEERVSFIAMAGGLLAVLGILTLSL